MRILICTNVYPPRFVGGAELVAHELALEMARLGHEVQALVGDLNGPIERHGLITECYDGITVHRVGMTHLDYDPSRQNMVHPHIDAYLEQVLERFRPHIVHAHNLMGFSVRAPILARQHGARTVLTLHDYWGICLRNTLILDSGQTCQDNSQCRKCLPISEAEGAVNVPMRVRKDLIALTFDHVDAFIAPSKFLAEYYIAAGVPRDKLQVIPNGIDIIRFTPHSGPTRRDESVRLLFVGYLGAHKGVDTLLSALAMMHTRQNVRLSLVGQGANEAIWRQQAANLGLEDNVIFAGRIAPSQMPQVYRDADIVVAPSIWNENQPGCLMEAMACGLPAVASRMGGIPEIVGHRTTGLLFTKGNATELADALDELVSSPRLRDKLGKKGRRQVESMTFRRQAEAVQALFHSVSNSRPSPLTRSIMGLAGDSSKPLARSDKIVLENGKGYSVYMIPISWLTASQKMKLTSIYIMRGARRLSQIFVPILSSALSILFAVMNTRQKMRLIELLDKRQLRLISRSIE